MNQTELFTNLQPSAGQFISTPPDISNLAKCIEDVKNAALDNDLGPQNPMDYENLKRRLEVSRDKLPPLYRKEALDPFIQTLDRLREEGFKRLISSPSSRNDAAMMMDIAQAILQNGEGYNEKATDAFQEVVSDLYDGFLSSESRIGVKPPDKSVFAPLVKWGNPSFGPYTWTTDATSIFGVRTAIVSLPPSNSKRGLLAWAALGHETGGHDILHADNGLLDELSQMVRTTLREKNIGNGLPDYWANRIDETASDVMGILNMGPATGIGLIGYFRGLNFAFMSNPVLRNEGPESDPHPADILRGYLAASSVGSLEFNGANNWAKIIEDETNKDLSSITIAEKKISADEARESASIVASTIMNTKLISLENHKLSQIQNWRNQDESIVDSLGSILASANPPPSSYDKNIYATHVVAAAVMKAVARDANIPLIFGRMQDILKVMHNNNPVWGPLYVKYPGNIVPHIVYSNVVQSEFYH